VQTVGVLRGLEALKDGLDARHTFCPQRFAEPIVQDLPMWAPLEVAEP
jgi:hypothetical protein